MLTDERAMSAGAPTATMVTPASPPFYFVEGRVLSVPTSLPGRLSRIRLVVEGQRH
jgi:hypothetical protein